MPRKRGTVMCHKDVSRYREIRSQWRVTISNTLDSTCSLVSLFQPGFTSLCALSSTFFFQQAWSNARILMFYFSGVLRCTRIKNSISVRWIWTFNLIGDSGLTEIFRPPLWCEEAVRKKSMTVRRLLQIFPRPERKPTTAGLELAATVLVRYTYCIVLRAMSATRNKTQVK